MANMMSINTIGILRSGYLTTRSTCRLSLFDAHFFPSLRNCTVAHFSTEAREDGFEYDGDHLKYAYALTSYFKAPEHGVEQYELLSRGSLAVIPFVNKNKRFGYHFLGPAHVTHPWLYQAQYSAPSQAWIQHLKEENVMNTFGLREKHSGDIQKEFKFRRKAFKHPEHDLIVLHLEDEQRVLGSLDHLDRPLQPLTLDDSRLLEGENTVIIGHELVVKKNATEVKDVSEAEVMVPMYVGGVINQVMENMACVATRRPVPFGVCGGPVLREGKPSECLGLVAALVMLKQELQFDDEAVREAFRKLNNNALIIKASVVQNFLKSVETELLQE